MPKTKRECIPRAKETRDLVEDEKIRSKAAAYIAHSPAHPLYHSSINKWPQSKDQHENYAYRLQKGGHSSQEAFPKEMWRVQRKFSIASNKMYYTIEDFYIKSQKRTGREIR